jgi:hypothetical protein
VGAIDLCHLDEAGVAPTLPTTYSWSPIGQRLTIPYEAPQGRRVNAIGAVFTHGAQAGGFYFESYACLPKVRTKKQRQSLAERAARYGLSPEEVGPIDSERFLRFVWRVAGRPDNACVGWKRERLLVIVLDNYSVHKSARVQAEEAALLTAGVILWYLPAYTPEMSAIELIWQDVKYHRMQRRSHDQLRELKQAFDSALTEKAADLYAAKCQSDQLLRRAA